MRMFLLVWMLLASASVHAAYSDECRALAESLARAPGSLKVAELDLLKNCVSGLQRGIVLGEEPPAAAPPAPVTAVDCPPPAPVASAVCAPCAAAPACPKAAPAARERRDPPEDRRLKPYLPKY